MRRDTATYLESALSEHYLNVATLTGSLSLSERTWIVTQFAQRSGILISTAAISTAMPDVAAVIVFHMAEAELAKPTEKRLQQMRTDLGFNRSRIKGNQCPPIRTPCAEIPRAKSLFRHEIEN